MKYLYIAICLLTALTNPGPLYAGMDNDQLKSLTANVKELCLHPDRRGDYLKVEGNASGGVVLRVVGANIGGTITHETWNGINQRIDNYKTDPRECTVKVLELLIPALK